jgi:hypothetical protein
MDALLSGAAAVVASGLAIRLGLDWRRRSRSHVAAWTLAMGMYALATWALFVGVAVDWTSAGFRVFYGLGAVLNVPFLGIGSVYLVAGERAGRRALEFFSLAGLVALFVTFTAPFVEALPDSGLPEGSEVFADVGEVGPAGPRFYALFFNIAGTMMLAGVAVASIGRFWRRNRRLAVGNLLIVFGAVFPALGGSLFALGETSAFALSLLTGAMLLWAGFETASRARSTLVAGERQSAH